MNKGDILYYIPFVLQTQSDLIIKYIYLSDFDDKLYEVANAQGIVTIMPKHLFYATEQEAQKALLKWIANAYSQLKATWFPEVDKQ